MNVPQFKKENLNQTQLPRHIAIIMDGNGRWANERHLPRHEGHRHGVESVREIIRASSELNIQYLTLYAFSKENWSRSKDEVNFLMKMLGQYLDTELKEMQKSNIRFRMIGRLEELPVDVQKKIKRNIEQTKTNTGLTLTLALSYSGRAELVDAFRKIALEIQMGAITPGEINEKMIQDALYTHQMPDPDLLIRTSGEQRISNFMLWQISYAELYITKKNWPDFHRDDLIEAISNFQHRDRRFGRANDLIAKH
ncbi:MAG: isoprenyl transferase [Candidatus Omnitrophica bacterium CG11_big_fil_rev_8_21_14_0_20_45_26]|uniref:Isoprenyl transferase n=1 Tax=Candidatus Abzuiibacterium crystallinum TaxID=1974748 RepID=A0A2H0LT18_9BACT|nr:MAG: isoprenyl transferase [Candidatus Omnitrophica bacterium CG11_big_fil_rev_8_21_14_0_20_45_26]PIW65457.1 MAG: isoprenyl transferase [Candidatus Omnitrophica bacterium CG12_big_fil_rev_8_21_14_0_65_45_16]